VDSTALDEADQSWPLLRVIRGFERVVMTALIVLMMIVIALSTVELGWLLYKDITSPPIVFLEVDELLDVFGFFLLVLIGIELLETVKTYLRRSTAAVRVEVVLEVALIAIARKVVALDLSKYSPFVVLGIAALIATLALAIAVGRRMTTTSVPAR
jgi:uncharacterized membrane protein (DUF373 family)